MKGLQVSYVFSEWEGERRAVTRVNATYQVWERLISCLMCAIWKTCWTDTLYNTANLQVLATIVLHPLHSQCVWLPTAVWILQNIFSGQSVGQSASLWSSDGGSLVSIVSSRRGLDESHTDGVVLLLTMLLSSLKRLKEERKKAQGIALCLYFHLFNSGQRNPLSCPLNSKQWDKNTTPTQKATKNLYKILLFLNLSIFSQIFLLLPDRVVDLVTLMSCDWTTSYLR